MNKLIDRFADTIPTSQARIALEILKDGRDAGEISTVDEYNTALKKLMETSSRKNPVPFFKLLYPILSELSSSGDLTYTLRTLEADLRTIFTETDSIMRIVQGHFQIFQQGILKDLSGVVEKLEQEILTYQKVSGKNLPHGFQLAQTTMFSDVNDARKVLALGAQAIKNMMMYYQDEKGNLDDTQAV